MDDTVQLSKENTDAVIGERLEKSFIVPTSGTISKEVGDALGVIIIVVCVLTGIYLIWLLFIRDTDKKLTKPKPINDFYGDDEDDDDDNKEKLL